MIQDVGVSGMTQTQLKLRTKNDCRVKGCIFTITCKDKHPYEGYVRVWSRCQTCGKKHHIKYRSHAQ